MVQFFYKGPTSNLASVMSHLEKKNQFILFKLLGVNSMFYFQVATFDVGHMYRFGLCTFYKVAVCYTESIIKISVKSTKFIKRKRDVFITRFQLLQVTRPNPLQTTFVLNSTCLSSTTVCIYLHTHASFLSKIAGLSRLFEIFVSTASKNGTPTYLSTRSTVRWTVP